MLVNTMPGDYDTKVRPQSDFKKNIGGNEVTLPHVEVTENGAPINAFSLNNIIDTAASTIASILRYDLSQSSSAHGKLISSSRDGKNT